MAVRKGYKQSPEHVQRKAAAVKGERNGQWTGDAASWNAGHLRALRLYPDPGPCAKCGRKPAERHHKDGTHANNDPSNIEFLCRRCHMEADGRLDLLERRVSSTISSVYSCLMLETFLGRYCCN